MSARLFVTVHNPAQGFDATVHLARYERTAYRPDCGTRANVSKLVVEDGMWAEWITCERCRKKLRAEGILPG